MILACPNCSAKFRIKPEALGTGGRKVKCAKCGHQWHATPDMLETGGESAAAARPQASAPQQQAPAPRQPEAASPPPPPPPPPEPEFEEEDLPPPPPPPAGFDDGFDEKDDGSVGGFGSFDEPPPIPDESAFRPTKVKGASKLRSPLKAWIALGVIVAGICAGLFFGRVPLVTAYPPAAKLFMMVGLKVDILGHGLVLKAPKAKMVVSGGNRQLIIEGEIENTLDDTVEIPMLKGSLRNTQGIDIHVWGFKAGEDRILPGETLKYKTEVTNPPRGATELHVTFAKQDEIKKAEEDLTEGAGKSEGGKDASGEKSMQQDGHGDAATDSEHKAE